MFCWKPKQTRLRNIYCSYLRIIFKKIIKTFGVAAINLGARCLVPKAKTWCRLPERAAEKNCPKNSILNQSILYPSSDICLPAAEFSVVLNFINKSANIYYLTSEIIKYLHVFSDVFCINLKTPFVFNFSA